MLVPNLTQQGGKPENEKEDKTMAKNEIPYKIYLNESEMPKFWYNLRADMKNKPAPLLNPAPISP